MHCLFVAVVRQDHVQRWRCTMTLVYVFLYLLMHTGEMWPATREKWGIRQNLTSAIQIYCVSENTKCDSNLYFMTNNNYFQRVAPASETKKWKLRLIKYIQKKYWINLQRKHRSKHFFYTYNLCSNGLHFDQSSEVKLIVWFQLWYNMSNQAVITCASLPLIYVTIKHVRKQEETISCLVREALWPVPRLRSERWANSFDQVYLCVCVYTWTMYSLQLHLCFHKSR